MQRLQRYLCALARMLARTYSRRSLSTLPGLAASSRVSSLVTATGTSPKLLSVDGSGIVQRMQVQVQVRVQLVTCHCLVFGWAHED